MRSGRARRRDEIQRAGAFCPAPSGCSALPHADVHLCAACTRLQRKKRCGTSGVVASVVGTQAKVRFEDPVLDPSTGAVSRVDTATILFPVSALANDPDAPAAEASVVEAPAAEPAAAEPPVLGGAAGLGPAFTRGEIEPPAGEKTVGSATIGVYSEEQQSRLGVDEEGNKLEDAAAAAAAGPSVAPSLEQDVDFI